MYKNNTRISVPNYHQYKWQENDHLSSPEQTSAKTGLKLHQSSKHCCSQASTPSTLISSAPYNCSAALHNNFSTAGILMRTIKSCIQIKWSFYESKTFHVCFPSICCNQPLKLYLQSVLFVWKRVVRISSLDIRTCLDCGVCESLLFFPRWC